MAARGAYRRANSVYWPYGNRNGRGSAVHVYRKRARKANRQAAKV
jgi:hypothetical protein